MSPGPEIASLWANMQTVDLIPFRPSSAPGQNSGGEADGKAGLIATSNDVGALTEALRRLTRDPDLCLRLAREAKKSASAMSLRSVAREWEEMLGFSHGDQPNYS